MSTPRLTWIPLAALALLSSPALADSPCTGIPRFDAPLVAEPATHYLRPNAIRAICDRSRSLAYVFGCADEVENVVYLTDQKYLRALGWSERDMACLERHEQAHLWHVDGTRWAGDHRGLVFATKRGE